MTNDTTDAAASGTLVSWAEGIGDDKKYTIAHVSPAGVTLVAKMKEHAQWEGAVAAATESPEQAASLLQQMTNAIHLAPDAIAKVTYSEKLWQLTFFGPNQGKTKVPPGKEQAEVFTAIKQHLGGTETEEEADAWSVMQSPLFILAVIAVIGGFFIYFTSICEPDFEASGRRSGMKQMMNSVGYAIGPVWMSVIVGSLAAFVLLLMIIQLIKRPVRMVLERSELAKPQP